MGVKRAGDVAGDGGFAHAGVGGGDEEAGGIRVFRIHASSRSVHERVSRWKNLTSIGRRPIFQKGGCGDGGDEEMAKKLESML